MARDHLARDPSGSARALERVLLAYHSEFRPAAHENQPVGMEPPTMFKRILSSAVAVASLAAATPALAENHDHSRNAQSRAAETCPCCAATDEASGGQASLAANEDPLDRSMDAGG